MADPDDMTGKTDKIEKSEEEWRGSLTPQQFEVARRAGTEPAFSGEYCETKDAGTYHCVCCKTPLFSSDSKYDSGTGWPSFYEPVSADVVRTESDSTLGMVRTEALCSRCDAHLGHVFPDGPAPTGDRYCMNSASLVLERDDDD